MEGRHQAVDHERRQSHQKQHGDQDQPRPPLGAERSPRRRPLQLVLEKRAGGIIASSHMSDFTNHRKLCELKEE